MGRLETMLRLSLIPILLLTGEVERVEAATKTTLERQSNAGAVTRLAVGALLCTDGDAPSVGLLSREKRRRRAFNICGISFPPLCLDRTQQRRHGLLVASSTSLSSFARRRSHDDDGAIYAEDGEDHDTDKENEEDEIFTWEEQVPTLQKPRKSKSVKQERQQQRRQILSVRSTLDDNDANETSLHPQSDLLSRLLGIQRPSSNNSKSAAEAMPPEPHPLRTDLWHVQIHWKHGPRRKLLQQQAAGRTRITGPHQRRVRKNEEEYGLEFADNGYVRVVPPSSKNAESRNAVVDDDDDEQEELIVGNWNMGTSGLTWSFPTDNSLFPAIYFADKDRQDELHFFADFLANPFGPQPRLVRGVVVWDQQPAKKLFGLLRFRPVVATFTATGAGEDTADFSYRQRKKSL